MWGQSERKDARSDIHRKGRTGERCGSVLKNEGEMVTELYFKSCCHIFQFSNTSTQHQHKTNAEKKKTCTQNYTQFCVVVTPPYSEEKGLVATFEF